MGDTKKGLVIPPYMAKSIKLAANKPALKVEVDKPPKPVMSSTSSPRSSSLSSSPRFSPSPSPSPSLSSPSSSPSLSSPRIVSSSSSISSLPSPRSAGAPSPVLASKPVSSYKPPLGQVKTTTPPTSLQKSKSEPAIKKFSPPITDNNNKEKDNKNNKDSNNNNKDNNNKNKISTFSPPLPKFASAMDVKVSVAQNDPSWQNKGKEEGLVIWRIEKFQVKEIQKASYGRFYNGDSYIVLNTYCKNPKSRSLSYDVHFWLGSKTTQDESGTAAYKTVELDDYLGGRAVQHREVESYESDLFLSYFSSPIVIMEGGIESGFFSVKSLGKEYRPRLLQLKGRRQVRVVEVPLSYKSLNGGDAFVLDAGLKLYQWNGNLAGGNEKHKASLICTNLIDERKGEPKVIVYHEGEKEIVSEFWTLLGGQGPIASALQGGDDEQFENEKKLFKLSDESKVLKFTLVAKGKISRSLLKSEDAFIIDSITEVFAWVGSKASEAEKKFSLKYAQDYLKKYNRPSHISVCRILEGAENRSFDNAFDS